MRDITLTDLERLGAFEEAERTFQMTEEAFRTFYELTARPVWLYLARTTGDRRLADDLLQEAYYRFLRARGEFESDEHRRNYLFRIATNLVRDHRRRPSTQAVHVVDVDSDSRPQDTTDPAAGAAQRIDLARAFEQMTPRERSMLWLAYAYGWSHQEIAQALGLKTGSLKPLLHRARRRLVALLGPQTTTGGRS